MRKIEFPTIVIEVQSGTVVVVYYLGLPAVPYAVFDNDQQARGEEAVSIDHTWHMDDLPPEMREAIIAVLPEA